MKRDPLHTFVRRMVPSKPQIATLESLSFMKGAKSCLILLLAFLFQACWLTDRNQEKEGITSDIINNPSKEGDMPKLTFDEKVHDFGTISQGERVEHSFVYRNTGKAPLVIVSIEPSCGCTVAEEAPDSPIAPGRSDTLTATYDSKGHSGHVSKAISVVANTSPKTTVVRMKGTVKGPR